MLRMMVERAQSWQSKSPLPPFGTPMAKREAIEDAKRVSVEEKVVYEKKKRLEVKGRESSARSTRFLSRRPQEKPGNHNKIREFTMYTCRRRERKMSAPRQTSLNSVSAVF